jgi:hypothetical protein
MARRVYVEVTTRLILDMDEDLEVQEVISELDYHFNSGSDGCDVLDYEIRDHEVKDSK